MDVNKIKTTAATATKTKTHSEFQILMQCNAEQRRRDAAAEVKAVSKYDRNMNEKLFKCGKLSFSNE